MSQSVVDVLSHHMTCVSRSDVDGIMQDYTDSSVLFSPDGVLTTLDLIREFYVTLTSRMLPPGTNFTSIRHDIRGDTAFLIWKADTHALKFHLGVETIVIRDGKIVTHSFAAAVENKE